MWGPKNNPSIMLALIGLGLLVADFNYVQATTANAAPGFNGRHTARGGFREPGGPIAPAFDFHQPMLAVAVPAHRYHSHYGRYPQNHPSAPFNARHLIGPAPNRSPMIGHSSASPSVAAPIPSNSNHLAPSVESPKPTNLSEVCSQLVSSTEKQLLSYISGIEAIAGTIQDLDEVAHQMRQRSCEPLQSVARTSSTPPVDQMSNLSYVVAGVPLVNTSTDLRETNLSPWSVEDLHSSSRVAHGPGPEVPISPELSANEGTAEDRDSMASTESFLDPAPPSTTTQSLSSPNASAAPITGNESRIRRDQGGSVNSSFFGLPVNSPPRNLDHTGDDLVKVSNDLSVLKRDLVETAEWLRQTNHTVHSALVRALTTYVSSIERRIESQRQLYAQYRNASIKPKIEIIKEKITTLLEKLRSIIPTRIVSISRDDRIGSNSTGLRGLWSPGAASNHGSIELSGSTAAPSINV